MQTSGRVLPTHVRWRNDPNCCCSFSAFLCLDFLVLFVVIFTGQHGDELRSNQVRAARKIGIIIGSFIVVTVLPVSILACWLFAPPYPECSPPPPEPVQPTVVYVDDPECSPPPPEPVQPAVVNVDVDVNVLQPVAPMVPAVLGPLPLDTTGDGVLDSIVVDTTGDGRPDTVIDNPRHNAAARMQAQFRGNQARQQMALPPGWTAHRNAEGKQYYYKASTDTTRWEPPKSWM